MPLTRDFLDRFRPAGAPGAAARAGVPADRVRELAADVHAEGDQILGEAHREAARIAAEAHTEVMRIERDGQRRARAARDEATAAVLAQARAEAQEAAAGADRQALGVRRLAKRRMPELVATAVGLVRAGVDGQPGLADTGQDVIAEPP
jgi:vacuolar-type H+-ATPase subunit H